MYIFLRCCATPGHVSLWYSVKGRATSPSSRRFDIITSNAEPRTMTQHLGSAPSGHFPSLRTPANATFSDSAVMTSLGKFHSMSPGQGTNQRQRPYHLSWWARGCHFLKETRGAPGQCQERCPGRTAWTKSSVVKGILRLWVIRAGSPGLLLLK